VDRERLKLIRENRQLSLQDLALRVGVSLKQIWRYEMGENVPSADVLKRIAQELSVSSDYLLGLIDDPQAYTLPFDLSPNEWQIINAHRRGDLKQLMRLATGGD
jgi:transcriptional regulator with XRE-family HTH domain